MIFKARLMAILVGGLAIATIGCNECPKVIQTIQDLTSAKALLQQGLESVEGWAVPCVMLSGLTETFRGEADGLRRIADPRYSGLPRDCLRTGATELCRGGWKRQRNTSTRVLPPSHYPSYFPYHPRWSWVFEQRVCEQVTVCLRFAHDRSAHLSYEQLLSVAYELDQSAGGLETACQRQFDGAARAELDQIGETTLERIDHMAAPDAQNIYEGLECSRSGD